jgi:hypothetical protein
LRGLGAERKDVDVKLKPENLRSDEIRHLDFADEYSGTEISQGISQPG